MNSSPSLLEVQPRKGIGPIAFGMDRAEVAEVLKELGGSPVQVVKSFGYPPIDVFDDLGLHIHYRPDGVVEAIEAFMPAAVALNGRVLLQESVEELRRWLGQLDPATEDDDAGFASPSLGLGFYVPDSEGDRVEAVIAHEPGYYDRDR